MILIVRCATREIVYCVRPYCKEYQEDLRIKVASDKAAQETQKMLEVCICNCLIEHAVLQLSC